MSLTRRQFVLGLTAIATTAKAGMLEVPEGAPGRDEAALTHEQIRRVVRMLNEASVTGPRYLYVSDGVMQELVNGGWEAGSSLYGLTITVSPLLSYASNYEHSSIPNQVAAGNGQRIVMWSTDSGGPQDSDVIRNPMLGPLKRTA